MECQCHQEHMSSCVEIVPIFSSLSRQEMLEVESIAIAKKYARGDMIYMEGDQGDRLYVVHRGLVKVFRLSPNGKEQVIRVLGPGEFMGELALFSPATLTDNAVALEEASLCLIEGTLIKDLMQKHPLIAFKVIEELSKRLESAENLIRDINLHPVEQRLAEALLRMVQEQEKGAGGGDSAIVLPMTKGALASQLGMTQETLSRKLSSFQEQGLIELQGARKIVIIDRDGLDEIAAGLAASK
ncbi:MAG TPA: Crp/Fnr family transcriptional regulator [Firmicutes bacterium]|nr:Crp/Fnr family transcriptional regulator [Bacillota bacterium]HBL49516.1 Crp/Fnr family transcriptional regulator [Bacillota bacterium]